MLSPSPYVLCIQQGFFFFFFSNSSNLFHAIALSEVLLFPYIFLEGFAWVHFWDVDLVEIEFSFERKV